MIIEKIVEDIKLCLESKAYYSALGLTLMVPDICAALQSPDGKTGPKKYAKWVEKYLRHEIKPIGEIKMYKEFMPGKTIYHIRCAFLHQGKLLNHNEKNFDRVYLSMPDKLERVTHLNQDLGALNLNLINFCNDMIISYEVWVVETKNDSVVIKNSEEGLKYYPPGTYPYIHFSGPPILG